MKAKIDAQKIRLENFTGTVNQPNGDQYSYRDGLLIRVFGIKKGADASDAFFECQIFHFEVERKKRRAA